MNQYGNTYVYSSDQTTATDRDRDKTTGQKTRVSNQMLKRGTISRFALSKPTLQRTYTFPLFGEMYRSENKAR